jgi:hypothetical protein
MTAKELRTMIETLLDQKLAPFSPLPTRTLEHTVTAAMRRRAASAAGRFHSGHPDISVNHDEYLTASYLE